MRTSLLAASATLALSPLFSLAIEINGVETASMDQPRVTLTVRRTPAGPPLAAKGDAGLAQMLGLDKEAAENVAGFSAFLDTGASGVLISKSTADALGVTVLRTGADRRTPEIIFHDIGIGGTDQFHVSEPLHVSFGPYQALGGLAPDHLLQPAGGPWNCQVGPLSGGGILETLIGGINILGMPAMVGRIVYMDPRPVNRMDDVMQVKLLTPEQARQANLPKTDRHIVLSYGDFGPFTTVEPANARRPITAPNPFIGPDPTGKNPRKSAPIVLTHRGRKSEASWLLDTGAAASMISVRQAERLGIRYKEGTQGTASPVLEGVPREKQFTLAVGGIGGMKTSAGFYVEEMRIPTTEGDDLVYRPAPVLVNDITVEHPQTKQQVTLDGVLGMNFLVASANVSGGMIPNIGNSVSGPFDAIIIDHTTGIMGVQLSKELTGK